MPSRGNHGEGHGSGEDPGDAAVKDCPAQRAWNVQKVAAGTGEAPPRPKPIAVSVEERRPITGEEPGSGWGVGRESEAVVPSRRRTRTPPQPGRTSRRRCHPATTGDVASTPSATVRNRPAGPATGCRCGTAMRSLPGSTGDHRTCCPACPHPTASPIRQPPRTRQKSHPSASPANPEAHPVPRTGSHRAQRRGRAHPAGVRGQVRCLFAMVVGILGLMGGLLQINPIWLLGCSRDRCPRAASLTST